MTDVGADTEEVASYQELAIQLSKKAAGNAAANTLTHERPSAPECLEAGRRPIVACSEGWARAAANIHYEPERWRGGYSRTRARSFRRRSEINSYR
jgi:hypothetical protein